jgi:hypothetical protein
MTDSVQGPERLAALLRTHPMFGPIEDDTASPTQRGRDEIDSAQRRQRADGLAEWLLARGVSLPDSGDAPRAESSASDFIRAIKDETLWEIGTIDWRALPDKELILTLREKLLRVAATYNPASAPNGLRASPQTKAAPSPTGVWRVGEGIDLIGDTFVIRRAWLEERDSWRRTAERLQAELTEARAALGSAPPEPQTESKVIDLMATLRASLHRSPEWIARQFHDAYERLAPQFGYTTRPESAVPWDKVPEQNRRLMIAVVQDVVGSAPRGTLEDPK